MFDTVTILSEVFETICTKCLGSPSALFDKKQHPPVLRLRELQRNGRQVACRWCRQVLVQGSPGFFKSQFGFGKNMFIRTGLFIDMLAPM